MRTKNSVKYNGERRRGIRESVKEMYKKIFFTVREILSLIFKIKKRYSNKQGKK